VKQWWEHPITAYQKHPKLFNKGHILDIGARIGYNSLEFARALSPTYKVFAFDPDKMLAAETEEIIFAG